MLNKILSRRLNFIIVWGLALFCPALLSAQNYVGSPMTKVRLLKVIASGQHAVPNIVQIIKEHGVDFKITAASEAELLAVKTRRQIIDAVKSNYRAPAAAVAATKNHTAKSTSVARTDTTEEYERLYYQGLQMMSQLRQTTSREQYSKLAQSMKNVALQAIKLDASRPEAYKTVGSFYLLTGNFSEAEKYGQEAINRGGSLAFPVYHLSGTPHPETLHIGRNFITVESNQKFFQYNSGEITDIQPMNNYNTPNGSVAAFGIATSKDGSPVEWYFSPANTGSAQEARLIMRLIQKNAMRQ